MGRARDRASTIDQGPPRGRALAWSAVLVVALGGWLAPRGARACSCMRPPPPAEALMEADAAFEARAFSMRSEGQRSFYTFAVDQVWKGPIPTQVEIRTNSSGAACGRSYQMGTRYVIYARRADDGAWTDGLCSRTRTSHGASEDVRVLGPGSAPISTEPVPDDLGAAPTEPPRIAPATPVQPPPTSPGRRGCAMEKPHTPGDPKGLLVLAGLLVAIGRRRAVRSVS